eukprot:6930528-Prymnesium_polylepis.2
MRRRPADGSSGVASTRVRSEIISVPRCLASSDRQSRSSTHTAAGCASSSCLLSSGTRCEAHLRISAADAASMVDLASPESIAGRDTHSLGVRRPSHATTPSAAGPWTGNSGAAPSPAASPLGMAAAATPPVPAAAAAAPVFSLSTSSPARLRHCTSNFSVRSSTGGANVLFLSTAATTSASTRPGCACASRSSTSTSACATPTACGHWMPRK